MSTDKKKAAVTVTGIVATEPRRGEARNGAQTLSFRLADRDSGENTEWYTVHCFGELAANAARSLAKGDRVVVAGRLDLVPWARGEQHGVTQRITASTVGHDLSRGTSRFTRTRHTIQEATTR